MQWLYSIYTVFRFNFNFNFGFGKKNHFGASLSTMKSKRHKAKGLIISFGWDLGWKERKGYRFKSRWNKSLLQWNCWCALWIKACLSRLTKHRLSDLPGFAPQHRVDVLLQNLLRLQFMDVESSEQLAHLRVSQFIQTHQQLRLHDVQVLIQSLQIYRDRKHESGWMTHFLWRPLWAFGPKYWCLIHPFPAFTQLFLTHSVNVALFHSAGIHIFTSSVWGRISYD